MTAIAFLIGVVVLVVGLAVSIALHELGHLLPAKKFGVRVGQYMIGFGPTLWSRRKGETEYGFKLIPLGGYISMAGMYPPSPKEAVAAQDGESDTGADAAADTGRSGKGSSRTGRAGGGFFATMVQDARTANDETLHGRDDDRVFYKLPVWKRVVIMLGGPVMNFLLAIVLFTIIFSGIGVQTATTTVAGLSECVPTAGGAECTSEDPPPPAEAAGIEPGDVILSVAGTPVSTFADASAIIRESPGVPLTMVVERDGAEQSLTVTPATVESSATGADTSSIEVGFVGIRPEIENVRQPIWTGAQTAVENVGAVAGIIWQLPVKVYDAAASLVTGEERDPNGPLSVVGAGILAGEVAAVDAPIVNRVSAMLGLLASLNIALFVFNLIPLLPLDGGHVVVALWDGLKRAWAKLFKLPAPKPVDATKLVPVTVVVVIGLLVMGGVLILADIFNPLSII